jgi:flagellar L-ring protein precursor FlgH
MFTDLKAKMVGDLVTVIISEGTSSQMQASTDLDKKLDHAGSAGVGPFLKLVPELGFNSGQTSSASGTTTISNKLVAKVTAKVIKVLPNGNLEIQAQRTLITNKEKQEITLTGVLRQQDIEADNTVLSTFISDVEIKCTGKGAIGDRQKEGVISKIIRYIF